MEKHGHKHMTWCDNVVLVLPRRVQESP